MSLDLESLMNYVKGMETNLEIRNEQLNKELAATREKGKHHIKKQVGGYHTKSRR